ncbi:MAG: VIT1/CCC1 transporter family protein [Pseudomonadota bacterium]
MTPPSAHPDDPHFTQRSGWLRAAVLGEAIITSVIAISLVALGALGAKAGGAPMAPAIARVVIWGALAMALTALVGQLFGVGA